MKIEGKGKILMKYHILINILDSICSSVSKYYKSYISKNDEEINKNRSKALIHLFLKVKFGIIDIKEREELITDGPEDGGLDAYFIDKECVGNHNGYDDDLVHDIIKTVVQ